MNLRKWVEEWDDELIVADGFDDAIIGVVSRCGSPTAVCYDERKCIEILMAEGLSEEDAMDHFDFNVRGSYVGERTPFFLYRPPE